MSILLILTAAASYNTLRGYSHRMDSMKKKVPVIVLFTLFLAALSTLISWRTGKLISRESLPADKKAALQDLKKQALAGTLRRSEVRAYKAGGNKIAGGNRAFLSKLRLLRKRATAPNKT